MLKVTHAPLPVIPAYSISKAAALNMTQSLRAFPAGQGVTVHAVFLGAINTDATRGLRFRRPRPSPQRGASSMGWRKGKRTSSGSWLPACGSGLARRRGQGARARVRSAAAEERGGVTA
jgi:NAD(P)-dependent dehydrogenase (short-subunit alcohol dehydrogenase family)